MSRDTFIEIFEGTLGSGKTYSATCRIFNHLLSGGVVYTNIRLKWDEVKKSAKFRGYILDDNQFQYLNNEQIKEFNKHIAAGRPDCPVLLVIDEFHLFFNARDWSKTERMILDFNTQVRKVKISFVLLSQSRLNVDKQFLRMVQYIWRFKDMQKVAMPVIGIKWPLPQILRVVLDAQDMKLEIQRKLIWKDPEVFGWYESEALFTDLGMKDELPRVQMVKLSRKEIWQHRLDAFRELKKRITAQLTPKQVMKAALILFVLVGVFALSVSHLMKGKAEPTPATAQQSTTNNDPVHPSNRGISLPGYEVRRETESYASSESCFVPAYGPVRVGSRFGASVVAAIDPKSRTLWTADGIPHSY